MICGISRSDFRIILNKFFVVFLICFRLRDKVISFFLLNWLLCNCREVLYNYTGLLKLYKFAFIYYTSYCFYFC